MEFIHLATFLVALLSCFLSGLAGGGGSYITSPYWLLIGMSPAESGTTGNFMGIGLGAKARSLHFETLIIIQKTKNLLLPW